MTILKKTPLNRFKKGRAKLSSFTEKFMQFSSIGKNNFFLKMDCKLEKSDVLLICEMFHKQYFPFKNLMR